MEKFGIFELLDALSAMTPPPESEPAPEKGDEPAASDQKKRTPDASFAPPVYGAESAPAPSSESNAYGAFLLRHEQAKGKVKK